SFRACRHRLPPRRSSRHRRRTLAGVAVVWRQGMGSGCVDRRGRRACGVLIACSDDSSEPRRVDFAYQGSAHRVAASGRGAPGLAPASVKVAPVLAHIPVAMCLTCLSTDPRLPRFKGRGDCPCPTREMPSPPEALAELNANGDSRSKISETEYLG